MMYAYSESMLEYASLNLGEAFQYAINECYVDASEFGRIFANSRYSELFSTGNPHVTVGITGTCLARTILEENSAVREWPVPPMHLNVFTPEFWAGWALAQYQWRSCRTFRNILERIPLEEIIKMYHCFNDSLSGFFEKMDIEFFNRKGDTKLKRHRILNDLTQAELSELSGVKLRSIQMWEQRINCIDKAQANSLYRLARALHCSIEDLLEDPIYCGEIHLDTVY